MLTLEQVKSGAVTLANSAVKTGAGLYQKGKQQAQLIALDGKLAKAQRQLGALVYTLHKNGEQNEELVERYMETITAIEKDIAATRTAMTAACQQEAAAVVLCPQCGAEVDPDAIFCPGCGSKL